MAGERILSSSEINELIGKIGSFNICIKKATNACETIINSFTKKEIVESFYASGKYGETEKEEMEKILNAIKKYSEVINDESGLVSKSLSYLETQKNLVDSGSAGFGTTSSSSGSSSGGSASGFYGGYGAGGVN